MVVGRSAIIRADPSKMLRTANELHLPVGVPTRIILQSNDVIHSFWVPSLAGKQDLIPGRDNDITIVPTEDRHLPRPVRRILRRRSTRTWRSSSTSTAIPTSSNGGTISCSPRRRRRTPLAQAGYNYVTTAPVQRVPHHRRHAGERTVAPDLTHLASRRSIAAGTLPMSKGNLYGWVEDPQSLKPGSQDADDRPRARPAARRRRLSRDAQMTDSRSSSGSRARGRSGLADERKKIARDGPKLKGDEARRPARRDLAAAARDHRLARDRRPQGDRPPLHRHRADLPRARRRAGAADAAAAGAAGQRA